MYDVNKCVQQQSVFEPIQWPDYVHIPPGLISIAGIVNIVFGAAWEVEGNGRTKLD